MNDEQSGNHPKKLIKTQELAKILGVGISTVEQDRINGKLGIPFVKLGRSVRYKTEDIDRYLSSLKTFTSTSDTGR
jgi:excisionase family DNA binding protein